MAARIELGRLTLMFATALTISNPAFAQDDLPPVGRSRFDQLIGNAPVPYPFARLVKTINRQMQPDPGGLPPLKVTLIPLGRSLQRNAGAPDFFHFPRVVAAADGDNRPGVAPLKDRLFLGYHEKGEVVEVISYNDAAGRFEFQVVRDYAPGKTPKLFYARRSLCLACHQNAAPIFARPLWDETPANPAIAARLKDARRDFYRVKLTGKDDVRLTDPKFNHQVNLSPDGKHFTDVYQTHDVPPATRLEADGTPPFSGEPVLSERSSFRPRRDEESTLIRSPTRNDAGMDDEIRSGPRDPVRNAG